MNQCRTTPESSGFSFQSISVPLQILVKPSDLFVGPNNSVTVAVAISVNWRSDFLTMGFLILEETK
ncbi:hypothetical protein ACOTXH_21285, partial [Enterobacter cloacae complex sp. IR5434]